METQKLHLIKALTCDEKESIKNIAKKLRKNKDRRIFVVDSKGKLKGIITTTDIAYKGFEKNDLKAENIMTSKVKAIEKKDSLEKALEIMNDLQTFVCPVVDKGKIIGLISYHDAINYLFSGKNKK